MLAQARRRSGRLNVGQVFVFNNLPCPAAAAVAVVSSGCFLRAAWRAPSGRGLHLSTTLLNLSRFCH